MFRITQNTTEKQLEKYGEEDGLEALRKSAERRDRLEKIACMNTGKMIHVQISGEQAYADIADRDSELGYTDRLVINIPAVTPPQKSTNYDESTWDLMFQKTELYHELGHILYSDWPSYEDVLFGDDSGNFGVEEEHRNLFKDMWNCLEDSAIEKLLATRFNIKDDLRIKNDNLLKNNTPEKLIRLEQAIGIDLMEYKHPIGWIDTLMDPADDGIEFLHSEDRELFIDEIQPILDDHATDIINQSDPVTRNEMVWDLYEEVEPHLDSAQAMSPDDRVTFGMPDDAGEDQEGTPGQNPGEIEQSEKSEPFGDAGGADTEFNVQRDYEQELEDEKDQKQQNQSQNGKTDPQESMRKWSRVIQQEYDDGTNMELEVPEGGTANKQRKQEANRLSKPLERELSQRLQQARRSQSQSGKKTGKPDSKNLYKTQQGENRVFKKNTKPDAKDYSCMIVTDRSGSTSYEMIYEMEKATGALSYALEAVGVDTGVVTMYDGSIQLEKDFSEDTDSAADSIFRGKRTGGTPLSDALALARGRLENESSHPFVIVICDGKPDHRERYRDQLHKCDFPVMGVYLSDHESGFDEDHVNEHSYFHNLEMRISPETLDGVRNMVKKVMF